MANNNKRSVSIRVTVVFVFVLGTLLTALIAIGLQYYFSSKIATNAVTSQATQAAKNTQDQIAYLDKKAMHTVELLSQNQSLIHSGIVDESATDELFRNLLGNNNEFYAAYLGLENGDFYELINLEASPVIRKHIGASLTDRYAKVIIRDLDGVRVKQTILLNEFFEQSYIRTESSEYDARSRLWFRNADSIRARKTEPYLFQHLQAPGQTYSMQIENSEAVIAVDIALSTYSEFLSKQVTNATAVHGSEVYLFESDGTLIASNLQGQSQEEREVAPLNLSLEEKAYIRELGTIRVSNERDWAPMDYSISGEPRGYAVELTSMLADSLGLNIEFINGVSWGQLVEQFQAGHIEVLTPVYRTDTNSDWGLFSKPLLNLPMALATRKEAQEYRTLNQLRGKRVAIPAGWSIIPEIKLAYPDIHILEVESVSEALRAVKLKQVDAAIESGVILKYNLDIYYLSDVKIQSGIDISPVKFDTGLRYVFHEENRKLMELFDFALAQLSVEDRLYLREKWLTNNRQLRESQSSAVPYEALIPESSRMEGLGELRLMTLDGVERFVYTAPVDASDGQYLSIILNADDVLGESRNDVYLSIAITAALTFIFLPFCWLLANPIVKPIRLLALENEKIMRRQYHHVEKKESVIKEIDELAISLVNMSEAISEHELRQQKLMDSFVELIAQAIDDKSPYTGGHCHRVPELGLMLAEEASKHKEGYFGDFSIEDKDKYREFKLAAWLHDCGKITTPEHVVDKGSKLETNYNRIHEIRTRFEVLWRDAEIEFYKKLLVNPKDKDKDKLEEELASQHQTLLSDFEFVARSNIGGEAMEEANIERLESIASRTWVRNFDDRLGLSPIEEKRISHPPEKLPVEESLLANKKEHLIAWERHPEYDPKFGIKLEPTHWQNNQGELYNLQTRRGTLNPEERFRINEHIVSTIKILESLPFPPELANVPRYASTHHETLIGTGYPRKLTAKDLSIGERILVLADIFEALTADDRPYKKAKSLSVALDILHQFVQNQHIDPEVFTLFLTSGVYKKYAKKYLLTEQIDEVDISKYLNG